MACRQNALGAATLFGRAAQDPKLPDHATRRAFVTSGSQLTYSHSDGKSTQQNRQLAYVIPCISKTSLSSRKTFSLGRPRVYTGN